MSDYPRSSRPITKIFARWDAKRPKYWANRTLEIALEGRNIVYDCLDTANETYTEKSRVWYVENDGLKSVSPDTLFENPPLSAHEACQPCDIVTKELLQSQLALPEEGSDTQILNSFNYRGKKCIFTEYVRTENKIDLGTMMANLKTGSWEVTDVKIPNYYHHTESRQPASATQSIVQTDDPSIANPYNIPPRRLWDLHSNRILEVQLYAKGRGPKATLRMPH